MFKALKCDAGFTYAQFGCEVTKNQNILIIFNKYSFDATPSHFPQHADYKIFVTNIQPK